MGLSNGLRLIRRRLVGESFPYGCPADSECRFHLRVYPPFGCWIGSTKEWKAVVQCPRHSKYVVTYYGNSSSMSKDHVSLWQVNGVPRPEEARVIARGWLGAERATKLGLVAPAENEPGPGTPSYRDTEGVTYWECSGGTWKVGFCVHCQERGCYELIERYSGGGWCRACGLTNWDPHRLGEVAYEILFPKRF